MRSIGGADEVAKVEGSNSTIGGGVSGKIGAGVATVSASLSGGGGNSISTSSTYTTDYFENCVREISNSEYTIFLDDFHYIPREAQEEVARSIKAIAERGVRVCVASVPYRSDDIVRSNDELAGRLISIDFDYWEARDLELIGIKGLNFMGIDLAPAVVKSLASESLGSPQLMQTLCLNLCLELGFRNPIDSDERTEVSGEALSKAAQKTSMTTDYSTITRKLHEGAKQRGTQRKEFVLSDGSSGDVYRAILVALVQDSPSLSLSYDGNHQASQEYLCWRQSDRIKCKRVSYSNE